MWAWEESAVHPRSGATIERIRILRRPADISDLESMDTAALKLHLEREALLVTARIMRKPLRNAQAVLGAARDLGTYCISKPAQATTLSGPDGGAVQVTHRLEFIEPN